MQLINLPKIPKKHDKITYQHIREPTIDGENNNDKCAKRNADFSQSPGISIVLAMFTVTVFIPLIFLITSLAKQYRNAAVATNQVASLSHNLPVPLVTHGIQMNLNNFRGGPYFDDNIHSPDRQIYNDGDSSNNNNDISPIQKVANSRRDPIIKPGTDIHNNKNYSLNNNNIGHRRFHSNQYPRGSSLSNLYFSAFRPPASNVNRSTITTTRDRIASPSKSIGDTFQSYNQFLRYVKNIPRNGNNAFMRATRLSYQRWPSANNSENRSKYVKTHNLTMQAHLRHHERRQHIQEYHLISPSNLINHHQIAMRHFYRNSSIVCNDGSPAGYYFRRNDNSADWLMFLEGGWFCHSNETCNRRMNTSPRLMSSQYWPDHMTLDGILSADKETNPYWYDYNVLYLPYCSSDLWSGTARTDSHRKFAFMGSLMIQESIKESLPLLSTANRFIVMGTSAGGIGVALNVDNIQSALKQDGLNRIHVMGVTDSAWFLEKTENEAEDAPSQPHYNNNNTGENLDEDSSTAGEVFNGWTSLAQIHSIVQLPIKGIISGSKYWRGELPYKCKRRYEVDEQWKCYFLYHAIKTIKAPIFVFQWLFDEAQMIVDQVGLPMRKEQWDNINVMGERLRNSFGQLTNLFSPACISHGVLTKKNWHAIKIDDWSLPEALKCWEEFHAFKQNKRWKRNRLRHALKRNLSASRAKRKRSRKINHASKNTFDSSRQNNRSNFTYRGRRCQFKLVDRCRWPHCNQACPKLTNLKTGQQLDIIALLKSFGLNMTNVAHALGIEPETLENMENDVIFKLFTNL